MHVSPAATSFVQRSCSINPHRHKAHTDTREAGIENSLELPSPTTLLLTCWEARCPPAMINFFKPARAGKRLCGVLSSAHTRQTHSPAAMRGAQLSRSSTSRSRQAASASHTSSVLWALRAATNAVTSPPSTAAPIRSSRWETSEETVEGGRVGRSFRQSVTVWMPSPVSDV